MTESAPHLTPEAHEALCEHFRELKHNINNTLAVVMALSELAERNPAHYPKLAKAVLERGPDVVAQLQRFQVALGAGLKAPAGTAPVSS